MQDLPDQARQDLDMGPRGDFGNHAAERAVRVVLPDHGLRQYLAVAPDQRGGAVIARGFKGEDQCHFAQAFA
jgi:hypothetical protein